jgi:amino-acid N-acetyltransferase
MDVRIDPAREEDSPAIVALLAQHQLPCDGVRDRIDSTVVARDDGRVVATAALEIYGDGVLLRSVAVAPDVQGRGVGRDVIRAVLRMAKQRCAPAAYLLTTTAPDYFPRFGFERIARTDVPPLVRTSIEFTSACPATAVVMRCRL